MSIHIKLGQTYLQEKQLHVFSPLYVICYTCVAHMPRSLCLGLSTDQLHTNGIP